MRLPELLDIEDLRNLAAANYKATGMPLGVVDAIDGSILVGIGWQEVCTQYHRVHAISAERCRESDDYIKAHISEGSPSEYRCKNGLRDIGIPINVAGRHLATLFMGQFFYEGETADRAFFVQQARQLGFDESAYLRAVERVPVFSRSSIENILTYNAALARFISALAERELRRIEVEEELRSTNRAKDEFLGVLSHELRNPLAPILNSVYILHQAAPGGEQALRALGVVDRQTKHLARLVDDLLDVSRIARGKIELQVAELDLCAVARQTAEDYSGVMNERGLRFTLDVPPDPVWMRGDGTRLAQVIGNLLQNAAKFTPEGGIVALAVANVDAAVELRVRDTGVGMAPDLLKTIFQPFAQGKQGLARSGGGLGLGLALVKGIAELHGGSARADSAGEGRGAEFVVRFPIAEGGRANRSSTGSR